MSKTIYSSEKTLPYVYKCVHKTTGQFYIGYRAANKIPSHLDLPIYKTSSNLVRPYFDDFEWIIIAEFFNSSDAYDAEQNLIKENVKNPLLLNKCYDKSKKFCFCNKSHSDISKRKMSIGHTGKQLSNEHKSKISKSMKIVKLGKNKSNCQGVRNQALSLTKLFEPHYNYVKELRNNKNTFSQIQHNFFKKFNFTIGLNSIRKILRS